MEKGKRINKKAEEGPQPDIVKVGGLDRSYEGQLSTSPLKHRPDYDLYGSPKQNNRD